MKVTSVFPLCGIYDICCVTFVTFLHLDDAVQSMYMSVSFCMCIFIIFPLRLFSVYLHHLFRSVSCFGINQ